MDFGGIEAAVSEATGRPFRVQESRAVGGGCINEALCLEGEDRRVFLKLNSAERLPMFEQEAAGLAEIEGSGAIAVPSPIAWGVSDGRSWLALAHIELGRPTPDTPKLLGVQLAAMHRHQAAAFGWERDNTIGATEQRNAWTSDWVAFYGEQRLGFQLSLAATNGADTTLVDRGQRLIELLSGFFGSYSPQPSLLHGDLWGGNWAADSQGRPVLYDPAVYYGDREADIAMTELFGGFDDRFYQSYRGCWDIDPGYASRKVLYNLYHVLNHFNLFGGGYARQAGDMIERLLSHL